MKNVALNTEHDGTCRTIKAQYYENSTANFVRTDSFGASGVLVSRKVVKSAVRTHNAEVYTKQTELPQRSALVPMDMQTTTF